MISIERGSVVIDLMLRSRKRAAPAAPAAKCDKRQLRIDSSTGIIARDLAAPKQRSRVISCASNAGGCASNAKHASERGYSFGTECGRLGGRDYSDCEDVTDACLDTRTCFDLAKELR